MEIRNTPEFYTGAPVDPVDLRFRGEFVVELWRTLRTGHVVLTAPRRTGKTSVMDYLRDHPRYGFSVVSINVQDLVHPADFFQVLLDGLNDAHPDFVRDQLAAGWGLVGGVLERIDKIGVGGFKLELRRSDPDWRTNWRQHGDTLLSQARNTGVPMLFIIDEFPDMRIGQYYADPNRSIAHTLLGQISVSTSGLRRATLLQETERALADLGVTLAAHVRRQLFNRQLLDLENDFYIVEVEEGVYDFASGVLKSWWRKYHA